MRDIKIGDRVKYSFKTYPDRYGKVLDISIRTSGKIYTVKREHSIGTSNGVILKEVY